MTAGLHRAQEDQDLEHGAAGVAGALSVVGLAAAATHDTPTGALLGSAVAAHGGIPKVQEVLPGALLSSGMCQCHPKQRPKCPASCRLHCPAWPFTDVILMRPVSCSILARLGFTSLHTC
jgi:hypothetical protein